MYFNCNSSAGFLVIFFCARSLGLSHRTGCNGVNIIVCLSKSERSEFVLISKIAIFLLFKIYFAVCPVFIM